MKKILLITLAFLLLGQTPQLDGKFTVRIDQWAGLFSDEFIHPNPNTAVDMINFDVKNEAGRSFLQQRQGFKYVAQPIPSGGELHGLFISQIAGDSERIIIAHGTNGNWYQTGGKGNPGVPNPWRLLDTATDLTAPHCSFFQFKDTIVATGTASVQLFARSGSNPGIIHAKGFQDWPYRRAFLHQDRVYAYGFRDSTDSKLIWYPEFSLFLGTDSLDSAIARGSGGFVYIGRDDGDFITNVVPMDNHIVVYKSRSVYRVLISPSTNAPNEIVRVMDNVGAYGYDCVSEWNGFHYFIAENGVYEFDGVNFTKISDPINYWFADSITQSSGRAKVFKTAVVNNKLYAALPVRHTSNAADVGDATHFVYDLDLKIWFKYDFTGSSLNLENESHFMLRYEYSPACVWALLGGAGSTDSIYFGQRLIFVIDSASDANRDKICMFPEGWKDRGTDSIESRWSGAFAPLGDLQKRYNFERMLVYGKGGAADSFSVNFFSDWQSTLIDSVRIPFTTSPSLINKRIPMTVSGSLLRYTMVTHGGAPKINYIEVVGSERGMGNDTE